MTTSCPQCGSERTRRGGDRVWAVYLLLLAGGVLAVFTLHLHAGLVAGVMIAAIVLTHLLLNERVCLDCGAQWRDRHTP